MNAESPDLFDSKAFLHEALRENGVMPELPEKTAGSDGPTAEFQEFVKAAEREDLTDIAWGYVREIDDLGIEASSEQSKWASALKTAAAYQSYVDQARGEDQAFLDRFTEKVSAMAAEYLADTRHMDGMTADELLLVTGVEAAGRIKTAEDSRNDEKSPVPTADEDGADAGDTNDSDAEDGSDSDKSAAAEPDAGGVPAAKAAEAEVPGTENVEGATVPDALPESPFATCADGVLKAAGADLLHQFRQAKK
jgi:hypothetical protein